MAIAVTPEVGERDGLRLVLVEGVEGVADLIVRHSGEDLALEVGGRCGREHALLLLTGATGHLGAEQIDAAAVGVGQKEGAERAPFGIETLRTCPQTQEDLLDDVLGEIPPPQQALGEGEHGSAMSLVERGERSLVESGDGQHE